MENNQQNNKEIDKSDLNSINSENSQQFDQFKEKHEQNQISNKARPWIENYPKGIDPDIDVNCYDSLVTLFEESFEKFASRTAYSMMGNDVSYAQANQQSLALAAYLQGLGLVKGDRVAVMMPNTPQCAISVVGILRAGLVLVNVNPLYTARELSHQLRDSGAKVLIIMENFAKTAERCLHETQVKNVILCSMGDAFGAIKSYVVNFVLRYIKKIVPSFHLPEAVRWNKVLKEGAKSRFTRPQINPDDLALLQYTGGTTGVAKGAMLLHCNMVANALQAQMWNSPTMNAIPAGEQAGYVCALPLYHIFAFTVSTVSVRTGGKLILIPNPRDLPALFKELSQHVFHVFPGVNTLYNAIANHAEFDSVNWRNLKVCPGGGSSVQAPVAKLWLEKTGCPICEGYGLSETSPMVCANPVTLHTFSGTIGVPFPNTHLKLLSDDGQEVPLGQAGEIAISGPQVMAGYWERLEDTRQAMTSDGYFKSGDIGVMDERGYFKIVDRKKDMVLVSGFNVYPNEIEEVVASLKGVLECAAIGVPDEKTGEAVKLFVVKKDAALTESDVLAHCKKNLTAYKRPRYVIFRADLPKSPVGKILRRELRDNN